MKEKKKKQLSQSKRVLGLEILRLLSMLMIVTLHVLSGSGGGGVLRLTKPFSSNWVVAWILESFALQAVNCFGLISGYVQSERKWHLRQYIDFWLFVFFINLFVYLITGVIGWSNTDIWQAIINSIPWKSRLWYIQAYLGLVLLMPLLNILVEKWWSEKKILFVIAVLSVIPLIYEIDVFVVKNGYSTIWLCVLYVVGGIIKKRIDREMLDIKLSVLLISGIILTGLVFVSKWLPEWNTYRGTGEYREIGTWFVYSSPLVLLQATCTFVLFLKMRKEAPKWFVIISSASLGVYLIHKHPVIDAIFIANCTNEMATYYTREMILGVSNLIICIYACSMPASVLISTIARIICKKTIGFAMLLVRKFQTLNKSNQDGGIRQC